jgi:hypothetical protein
MYTSDVLGESSILTVNRSFRSEARETKIQSNFVSRVMSSFISRDTRLLVFLVDRIDDARHGHVSGPVADHQGFCEDAARVLKKEGILFEGN